MNAEHGEENVILLNCHPIHPPFAIAHEPIAILLSEVDHYSNICFCSYTNLRTAKISLQRTVFTNEYQIGRASCRERV